jgi:hypothetical protein
LYGQNWIAAFHLCQEWVEELLELIRKALASDFFGAVEAPILL